MMDEGKRKIDKFFNVLLIIFIFYFLYHTVVGEYGIISYIESFNALYQKQRLVLGISEDIEFRKNKINKMKGSRVDTDILDEEMRKKLGLAKKNEVVIYVKDLEDTVLEVEK